MHITTAQSSRQRATSSIKPQHLSSSQEDVLHLWPVLVALCKRKSGLAKVVQKTSESTPIVPQRLRNHCAPIKNNAATQKLEKKLAAQLRSERTKCIYSLRTWAFSTYMDTDMLYNDDVTYCKQCQKHFIGACSLHFKLVCNREVVRDGSVEERARHTAPWPLYVGPSRIPGAGEGVWTSAALPRGLVFGPYEGQILRLKKNSKAADSGYAWRLQFHRKSHRKRTVYVDSINKSISNWLRYVNCARDYGEMNLEAFQFKKDVYYITLQDIERNSELLVWYGDEYARELGIHNLPNSIISTPASVQEEPAKLLNGEEFERKGTADSSELNPLHNGQRKYRNGKMRLSKPQTALQHLFCPARLQPKENLSVKVVYVNSTNSDEYDEESSEGAGRKQRVAREKPRSIPSVRFNQKYNCKYNHAYCVECRKTYSSLCPKHPMSLILDKPVPRDGSVQNRAELTAPWPLYIAQSKVEDAGLGVMTSADLPEGLVFGPCEGCIIKKTGMISGYGWEIRGRPDIEIDSENKSVSNWVRYVNCARNYVERNLIAMQIQNEIFYVTNTEIKRGTELMVWYGAAYGSWLGITNNDFFKPRLKEAEVERWCSECQVLFTSPEFLSRHQERCGQKMKGKGRKRRLQDSDLFLHKLLETEEKPQKVDRCQSTETDIEESLSLETDASQDKDLSTMSDALVDSFSTSDHTMSPRFTSEHSCTAGKKIKNSEHKISPKLSETENNISLNSTSSYLDSFINHDEHFLDSLNLEESIADKYKSYFSNSVSHNSLDHSSGYSSFISSGNNCSGTQSSNVFDFSLPSSGLTCSPRKPGRRPQKPCTQSTARKKLSQEDKNVEKSRQIHNKNSGTMDCPVTPKTWHPVHSNERWRKCSRFDGTRKYQQNRDNASEKVSSCVTRPSQSCNPHPAGMLQRTSKKKRVTKATLKVNWKTRQDIDCKWNLSSHSRVERHRIYIRKKDSQGRVMAKKTQSGLQPQTAGVAHGQECIQNGVDNKSIHLRERERTVGISCDDFYTQKMSHQVSHQYRVEVSGNDPRQAGRRDTLHHGHQVNMSLLHQNDPAYQVKNHSSDGMNHLSVSSSRHMGVQREDSCARALPFQSLIKKHEHIYSSLCSRNGNGTLYECYKCRRKFASKYNLHAHQYFCS